MEDPEDEQLRKVLARSIVEMRHDPSEPPNTGGSAASSSPVIQSSQRASPVQSQPGLTPMMTQEELTRTQEQLKAVTTELADLNYRLARDLDFTQQDMERMSEL